MSQTIRLRDEVYQALSEAARAEGLRAEAWIAARLAAAGIWNRQTPTAREIARANARLRKHIVSSGQAGSCDNEQIDADLAREYGDDHAELYRREKR